MYSFKIAESGTYHIVLDFMQNGIASNVVFSVVDDLSGDILLMFKRIGSYILLSLVFVLIGGYLYIREKRSNSVHV